MRGRALIGVFALFVAIAAASVSPSAAAPGSPIATPAACPVTQPNGVEPPPSANMFAQGVGACGNEALMTSLSIYGNGVSTGVKSSVDAGGWIGFKWPWYRAIPGELTIEGHRLDAPAPPMRAETSNGYGNIGFEATGLVFPSAGCWEVTGHVGGGNLTFVLLVVAPAPATPVATPYPSS